MPQITFGFENYCSPTGNDSTGDGSIGNPYLTLARCLTELAGFSQTVSKPYQYFILRTWMRAGTYTEGIDTTSQVFPGDPASIVTQREAVGIFGYPGEAVTLQPPAGVNAVNLINNNGGYVQGPVCFTEFKNIIFDLVNITGKGIILGPNTHHNLFYQCEIINGPDDGLEVQTGSHDNILQFNEINTNAGDGILDSGDNFLQDNFIHDNVGDGIEASASGTIERNRCYNNANGIRLTGGNPLVRNNMAYDNSADGIVTIAGRIYNNTAYSNTVNGINATAPADPQNNICFSNGNDPIGIGSGNLDTGADPLFRDVANFDFHLTKGSPAIDIGNTLSDVPGDADLKGRPAGPAYDAGAFEFPLPGTVAAITQLDTHFALASGRACQSPMDYRVVQATPKSYVGTPKVGIALCVDPASTPTSFTGYVFSVQPQGANADYRWMRYDAQPLTGFGTILFQSLGVPIAGQPIIDQVMSLIAGTNTINSTNDLWANIYEATNTVLGGVDGAPLPRTNLGFGVVGIGATVSVMLSGDDIIITTEDGTFTFTTLQAGCKNSLTNIAAFEQTFTFNAPIAYDKTSLVFDAWNNYGIQTPVDVDVLCHCAGTDCYGIFWNSLYNYLEINPQGGDRAGDGIEFYFEYGGIKQGTPISGGAVFVHSKFTNHADGILYGVIIDEIRHTLEVIRWVNQSVQFKGQVLASIPWTAVAGDGFLVWIINSGSIRQAGDPAEIFVFHSSDGGATFPDTPIDDLLDSTPYGQIVESPNELLKWKNTNAGIVAVGTQSGNARDVAHYQNYMSMDQLL